MDLELLFGKEQIEKAVYDLSERICIDYRNKPEELVLIGVLKGSFIFLSDLSRKINIPHSIDFITVESYGKKTKQGKIRLIQDIATDIRGKHVIIVDDISDSGNTISYLVGKFRKRKPASLKTCTIMRRQGVDNGNITDYYALIVPTDAWVVGYGTDDKGKGRTLPNIYASRKV